MAASRERQGQSSGETAAKVKAACEECRTRKTRCNGARPVCGRCDMKGLTCVYETEPDEFRITALKRRYAELAEKSETTETLIRLLRDKSFDEALEILKRIRANESITSIVSTTGKSTADVLSTEAQHNLMTAIEEAKSSSEENAESSTSSKPHAVERTRPSASSSSQSQSRRKGTIDKASIAFLIGASTEPPWDEEPESAATISPVLSSHSDPPSTEIVRPSFEKRKRLSEPLRPVTQTYTHTEPPHSSKQPGYPSTIFRNKPRTQDKSWMRGIEHVKATDWGVYYTDDTTFLEILKCYFVWENPTLGFVHQESFWEGLGAGGSEFCNQSLVYAVLAYGSKIYGMFYPDRAATVEHFSLLEVTKLWDWDCDATVPANASAGFLIHATLTANGQDKDGQSYLQGATNLVMQSGLFSNDRVSQCYPRSNPKLARDRAEFAWDVYSYSGYHTLTFNREPIFQTPPPVALPVVDHDIDHQPWEPFPLLGTSRPCLCSSKANARAGLWRLATHILPLRKRHGRDPGSEEHWRDTKSLFEQLQGWYNSLHARLNILHGAAPHVFSLHTDYHRCIVDLMRPFVKTSEIQREPAANISAQAREITQASHIQLRMLVHQMELQFADLPLPLNMLLTPLVSVANETLHLMPGKSAVADERYYFTLCLKMMRRMASAYPLMGFLMLGLRQVAKRQGVELPKEARKLFEGLNNSQPGSLNSSYPVHHDLLTTDLKASNLQTLIAETDQLSLERGKTGGFGSSRGAMTGGRRS